MKHLRKAFSNHRLIRSAPDGDSPAGEASARPQAADPHRPTRRRWQRRKPIFPPAAEPGSSARITLWDENSHQDSSPA